jgi:putative mRNA 3-end processing factor
VGGHVTVVSGDYKVEPDRTCAPFEPQRCHRFISECTFGLPIYRWRPQDELFADVNSWWRSNQAAGRSSVLYAYSLGKAQRLLAGIDPTIGPILVHGAVQSFLPAYAAAGVELPSTRYATDEAARETRGAALIVAPPSAAGMAGWLRKFGDVSEAFASGWMAVRGARRRRAVDRGFVISDHADWEGLLGAIAATGAERVDVTHGFTAALSRYLNETGIESHILPTAWEGERGEADAREDSDDLPPAESDVSSDGSSDGSSDDLSDAD